MPVNAVRQIQPQEVESLLGNGLFMGLGPDQVLVAWGQPKKGKKPVSDRPSFYVPDFFLQDKNPWVAFEQVIVTDRPSFISCLKGLAEHPKLELCWQSPELKNFEKTFNLIQAEIAAGHITKAVPVVFSTARSTVTKAMRAQFILELLTRAIKPTPYGYLTPTEGVLGASPEILFSYDYQRGVLQTMALAGTRHSEREKNSSMENDPKEIYEHQLVIKGLKQKLHTLGELNISPTYVWDIGPISHLRTDITVEFADKPNPQNVFNEISTLLHPTAALGVAPNTADWHFLKKCDGEVDRRRFGAPFGVLSPQGRSVALVAIRCLQWSEDQVSMGAGCGIVAQSELQNEWQELELKKNTIKNMLGI